MSTLMMACVDVRKLVYFWRTDDDEFIIRDREEGIVLKIHEASDANALNADWAINPEDAPEGLPNNWGPTAAMS